MPEPSDRERAIAAYASEVRAFHFALGCILVSLAVLYAGVVFPFMYSRRAASQVAGALALVREEAASADAAVKATEQAAGALTAFREALDSGPGALRREITNLVARFGLDARASENLSEAIRQQIGRQAEVLGTALDAVLGPLRALENPPPEIVEALRTGERDLGRAVLALNEVLREAFAADPGFWQRLGGSGGSFGAASQRAEETVRAIEQAQRSLDRQLTIASGAARSRQRALQHRTAELAARQRDLSARLGALNSLPWSIPPGLGDIARLFPIAAGVLTLTVFFRLRRILALRRAQEGINLDLTAPSWVVGHRSVPGAWWALVLVCTPLAAAIHSSVFVLGDPGLFTTPLGDESTGSAATFGAVYAALVLVGMIQLPAIVRGLVGTPQRRPQGRSGRGGTG